jgi:Ferritin-like domain
MNRLRDDFVRADDDSLRPGDDLVRPRAVMRRRHLLAAAAAALLARPAAAAAVDGDPAVLISLIAREQAASFAYGRAAVGALPDLAADEADHAEALRTQLDALGRKPAPAPRSAADLDPAARGLAEAPADRRLDAAIALETSLLDDYEAAVVDLEIPEVVQTAATIMAAHAQHRALLRHAAGRDPFA